jgi:hypothetical protein
MLATILIFAAVISPDVWPRGSTACRGLPLWTRSPAPGGPRGTARRLPASTPRRQCPRLRPAGLAASSTRLLPCYYQLAGTLTGLTRSRRRTAPSAGRTSRSLRLRPVLHHDICLVSVLGLHGTLHVQEARNVDGVSVQAEGPYEAKVADGCWLIIYPEGQEPPIRARSRANVPIIAGRTQVGSVDAIASAQFLTDSVPRMTARLVPRVRTRASVWAKATVRITAPPGTRFGAHRLPRPAQGPTRPLTLCKASAGSVSARRG